MSLRTRSERYRLKARLSDTSKAVRAQNLTYLNWERLRVLERCAEQVDHLGVEGDFLECGVALGGSSVLLATLLRGDRQFHGYDVFGMIPPPTQKDPPEVHERYATISAGESRGLGGETYYGYREDLKAQVEATLASFGQPVGGRVELHEGLFEDTLHPQRPVALAHVDSDWFEPVDTCLRRIGPVLSPGGFIVLDDYYVYGGASDAADGFVAEFAREFALLSLPYGQTVAVVRRAA